MKVIGPQQFWLKYIDNFNKITYLHLFIQCSGAMGVLWVIGWLFLAYESPRVHPRINKTELDYSENSLTETGVTDREVSYSHIHLFHLFFPN